jgi:hypothetical protein
MRLPTPTFKCPSCGEIIPNRYKAGQPLTCPGCLKQLKPSRRYLNFAFCSAIGLTVLICFLLGFRGVWLLVAALLLWFPVDFVWMFLYVRLFPPKFEPYSPSL